jgi:putative copper export protein
MQVFSTYANILVTILLFSGGFLLYTIMSMEEMSWASQYGYNLIIKFSFVTSLLILAAGNKWYWVPRLERDGRYVRGLKRSIATELVLAISVLLTTAFLTTVSSAL